MSDRDADHMLNELQEARAEIERLRELLRWRDAKFDRPQPMTDCVVILGKNQYADVVRYLGDCDWSTGIITYWRPIGPMPEVEQ